MARYGNRKPNDVVANGRRRKRRGIIEKLAIDSEGIDIVVQGNVRLINRQARKELQ